MPATREKARILWDPSVNVKPLLQIKKAQLRRVALNPPKEEGGGDKLLDAALLAPTLERIMQVCLLHCNIPECLMRDSACCMAQITDLSGGC
jgi:hypothetical protein